MRAIVAVSIWPVTMLLGLVGLIAAMVIGVQQLGAGVSVGGTSIHSLTAALSVHANQAPGGQGPAHAIELTTGSQAWLTADQFADWQTTTSLSDVPLAGVDLAQYSNAAPAQQQAWAQQAAAAQPANVIAHRLGDFVFTYHGIDLRSPSDPNLWVIVYWPDPAVNPPPNPTETCTAALADGSTTQFPFGTAASELANQNALRAAHGLPPLPDPATVTHPQPATAP